MRVLLSRRAIKNLKKVPREIQESLAFWIAQVEFEGMINVRKVSGYHDEPLKGARKGERSIRLNRAYRAIYIQSKDGNSFLITVIEVNKHEY
ncbi:MAG: hypothetical protein K2P81_01755 [Bacteriovoracaceae bacterium]|nr:hypothetical protein [Bacteriovoracaceae bacterium]